MKKNKYIKKILLIAFAISMLTSCYKDIGNYNYNTVNQVTINGIEDTYSVLLGDHINIAPDLAFSEDPTGDTANYSYKWFALLDNTQTTLDTTKNLNINVNLKPANYQVYYVVTDKNTGIYSTKKFSLKVATSIYEGWLVLNNVNDVARLDMVSKIDDSMRMITDVLKSSGSDLWPLTGKAVDIYCYNISPSYGIYISTDQTTNRIDPETFQWKPTLNIKYEVLGKLPDHFHADVISAVNSGNAYLNAQGNVYYYFRIYQMNYGTPINIVSGEDITFKAAPFVASGRVSAVATAVLYDVEGHRFVRNTNNSSTCTKMPAPPTQLFDYNNTGMDLAYMEATTYNGDDIFAVLKNTTATKFYLARFSLETSAQNYYDEITGTDIDKAEHFAVDPTYGYLFYSVGGKLYEYDFVSKSSKLMLDKGSNVISMIKYQKFFNSKYSDLSKKLIVGSYDPSKPQESNGTLELYDVPGLNAPLSLNKAYQGFGEVVSISYRER